MPAENATPVKVVTPEAEFASAVRKFKTNPRATEYNALMLAARRFQNAWFASVAAEMPVGAPVAPATK